ncbi:MAG: 50S ribosomal protein L6 [Synergistales bacterium]
MSRIGRKSIPLSKNVQVLVEGRHIMVKGPKGELSLDLLPCVDVSLEEGQLVVTRKDDEIKSRAFHGMTRALLNNMVVGVSEGFQRQLEIVGVGYRAQMQGKTLMLSLGYSHPIQVEPPAGVEILTDGPTKILIKGADKQVVGQLAANIRGFRPPEPYKGKGIRYAGEYIIRKAGKAGSKK